jgi:SAM-dependent methyltransferase
VGCGFGALGRAILDEPACPGGVELRGLERAVRLRQMVPIDTYGGGRMPYDDREFDVVIIADVLHHEDRPEELLGECRRVCGRCLVVKDHKLDGLLAWLRVSFIDWAANAPYGVKCLYRYRTLAEWRAAFEQLDMPLLEERATMQLYPPVINFVFGRRLQYLAVLSAAAAGD